MCCSGARACTAPLQHPPAARPPLPPPAQTSGNNNFEGSLSDGLQAAGLGVPQLSVVDGVFIFWSNRTCEWPRLRWLGVRGAACDRAQQGAAAHAPQRLMPPLLPATRLRAAYDASNGGKPMYGTFLVARALRDGGVVWAQDFGALGFSTTPVSPPIVNVGVMAVTTARQLVVMDAGSGFLRYGMDQGEGRSRAGAARVERGARTRAGAGRLDPVCA